MTCCWRPTPASLSSSCTSSRRHVTPLIAYSLSPVRNRMRDTVTSLNSIGRRPAELSIVRLTSARPRAGRFAVPAKITSSIFCERTALGACAPSTHAIASTTFDLPDPFGPTTTVTPGSNWSVVASANDLKPFNVSDRRNTRQRSYKSAGLRERNAVEVAAASIRTPATDRPPVAARPPGSPPQSGSGESEPPGEQTPVPDHQRWHRLHQHVLLPAIVSRRIVALLHVRQRSPARSYTRWWSWNQPPWPSRSTYWVSARVEPPASIA